MLGFHAPGLERLIIGGIIEDTIKLTLDCQKLSRPVQAVVKPLAGLPEAGRV
jgi:hypothetical protein